VADLAIKTNYTVTIPAGAVKDSKGIQMTDTYGFGFMTTSPVDNPPTVVSSDPANGATNVSCEKVITVTFSENIITGNNFGTITLKAGETTISTSNSVSGAILTITPSARLEKGTIYTLSVPTGAVNDVNNNPLAQGYEFGFLTMDPPTVTGSDPVNGATNVPLNKVISVTFSKDIDQGTNWSGISVCAGTTPVAANASINGGVLTITPSSNLSDDVNYTVTIPAGAVFGQSENGIPGDPLMEAYTFSFLAGNPPVVQSTTPADGDTDIAIGTKITLVYDKQLVQGGNWNNIAATAGSTQAAISCAISNNVLTITPVTSLNVNTDYTVVIPAGAIKDVAGNVTLVDYSFTFKTNSIIFFETFNNGIPSDWTIVDGYNDGITWTFVDPSLYHIGSPFTNPCGVIDSDHNSSYYLDEELITSTIDVSHCNGQVYMDFANCFKYYAYSLQEIADVDISADNGTNWTNALRMTGSSYGPELKTLNITPAASGSSQVKIRFHYYNARDEFWWLVDDIKVYCIPPRTCNLFSVRIQYMDCTSHARVKRVDGSQDLNWLFRVSHWGSN